MTYTFGTHESITGGACKAVERAREHTSDCVQLFVSPPRKWPVPQPRGDPSAAKAETLFWSSDNRFSSDDCERFQDALQELRVTHPIAHASYLINLAAPDDALWNRSLSALVSEWQKSEQLKLEGLVLHPGSHTRITPQAGLERVARAVRLAVDRVKPRWCKLLLENTAGQGSNLGWQIEQLGWLLKAIKSRRVAICWDTCHALAAGYDFRTAAGMKSMVAEMERHRVLSRIQAIHVNDSQKDCGSRVDRHAHIGFGHVGEAGFRRFLRHSAFKSIPMYLETPKGNDPETGQDWDVRNLALLRELTHPRRRTSV